MGSDRSTEMYVQHMHELMNKAKSSNDIGEPTYSSQFFTARVDSSDDRLTKDLQVPFDDYALRQVRLASSIGF